jgi:hypothetical protein
VGNACALVCCNYLGDQNWPGKPYSFNACDPVSGAGGGNCSQASAISCGQRYNGANPGTTISPYTGWGLWMNNAGAITQIPSSGANAAPNPTY